MILRSLLLACLLNIVSYTGSEAANPPLLDIDSDFLTQELAQPNEPIDGNSKDQLTFKIPVNLGAKDLEIVRVIISQSGRLIPSDSATFKIEPVNGGILSATIDMSKFAEAGNYKVILEVSGHPQPLTGATQPPATNDPNNKEIETVKLTLVKPAAELKVSTPLRLERIIHLPGQDASIKPDKITLTENLGKSWLAISPASWNVDLRKGEETPEQNRLVVTFPSLIPSGGQADAQIKIEGPLSIGTISGNLKIRSPQLVNKTVDFPITVVSRIDKIWVLLTIFLGIWVGWLFRTKLGAKQVELEARLAAGREFSKLKDMIAEAVDEKDKEKLGEILQTLEDVANDPDRTPEDIKKSASQAKTEREAYVKEKQITIKDLKIKLGAWSLACRPTETLPAVVETVMQTLRDQVLEQTNALREGKITLVSDSLSQNIPEAAGKVIRSAINWLDSLDFNAITTPWPEIGLDNCIAELTKDVKELSDRLVNLVHPSKPDEFRNILADLANLLDKLNVRIFLDTRDNVTSTVDKILPFLDQKKVDSTAIQNTLKTLQIPLVAGSANSINQLAARLNDVWQAIKTILDNIYKSDVQQKLLKEGKFLEALNTEDSTKPIDTSEGFESLSQPEFNQEPIQTNVIKRDLIPTLKNWSIRLDGPSNASVSDSVTITAKLIVPDGVEQPTLEWEWSLEQDIQILNEATPLARRLRFLKDGSSYVEVTAKAQDGTDYRAGLRINITEAWYLENIRNTLKLVAKAQWVISASLIGGIGWFMFSPGFIGTLPEFFTAFVWGFTVDVGAAKVRELTQSAESLKPQFPLK